MNRFAFMLPVMFMGVSVTAMTSAATVYPKIKFTYTSDDIHAICASSLSRAQKKLDRIAALDNERRTFKNTMAGLEQAMMGIDDELGAIRFLAETSPSADVQDAANDCEQKVSDFFVRNGARLDLFNAVNAVAAQNQRLDFADAKLLAETLRGFKRNGVGFPEEQRAKIEALNKKISAMMIEFSKNYSRANDTTELTDADLEGLDEAFVNSLTKTNKGTYTLTLLDNSLYRTFMENAKSEAARKQVAMAKAKVVAGVNVPLLEKTIAARDTMAKLQGFESFAAFALDVKMAKTPARVMSFLDDLATKLSAKAKADLNEMLTLKKKDDPRSSAVELWDWLYYTNQLKKDKYAVDSEKIRAYFPVDHVLSSVMALYQKLLGVTFTEILPAYAWAPEVRLFEVTDTATTALIGHFYLDLYPRPNKYKHFAAFDIIHARKNADGSYHSPVSAVVGNWPKPTEGRPALLKHDDVETFFHEFGHIMHQTLTTARYSSLAGTNVRADFVEAPSQMLENWAWDRSILRNISRHYETGEHLPDSLLEKMIAAKHVGDGVYWERQIFLASVDMKYHTSGEAVDTTAIWRELEPKIMLMNAMEGEQPQATFGHLMGGYEAGYYGYLWSKVYAQDMFTVFQKEGLDSPTAGLRYREWILQPGGTVEPDVLLRNFLGREPNAEAFYKSMGL